MKVRIHGDRPLLEDVFRVDEVEVSYEQFDGEMSPRVRRLVFERGDSVAALVFHRERETVLLVNQFKLPAWRRNGPGWITETVAGILEPGEDPEEAMLRELREEAGYAAARLEKIGEFYVSPGGTSERIFLYYVEVSEAQRIGPGGGLRSESEDIRTVELTLEELRKEVEEGKVLDAKTLVAAMWLLERRTGGTGS